MKTAIVFGLLAAGMIVMLSTIIALTLMGGGICDEDERWEQRYPVGRCVPR